MKFIWRCKTDAELIQKIRSRDRLFARWKYAVFGFMILGIGIAPFLYQLELKLLVNEVLRSLETLQMNSYAKGHVMGFIGGAFVGATIAYFSLGIIAILGEVRRDRLLLAYHDRLRDAGLLPGESSGKIESDQDSREA